MKENCFVRLVTAEQMERLRDLLNAGGWTLESAPYCRFKASRDRTSVAAYESGKLVVQGKGASDFVEFLLEPQILGEDAFAGTDGCSVPSDGPFQPHAGLDESGKGDFFGPLVAACVFVKDAETAEKLEKLGVRDSKQIKSDAKIAQIAKQIVPLVRGMAGIVAVGPEAYNRCYVRFGNLNRLLAWCHARA